MMQYSDYPVNDAKRPPFMNPALGNLYPEEEDLQKWIEESDYEFADLSDAAEYDWRNWREWAVPNSYMYEDYVRWKRSRPYNRYDPDAPQMLTNRQFGIALRWLMPEINPTAGVDLGCQRKTVITRRCFRLNKRRTLRVIRGIKHPDAFYIDSIPGRRPDAFTPPAQT